MYRRLLKSPLAQRKSFYVPSAVYLDLLEFDLYQDLSARPGRFVFMVETARKQ